MAHSDAIRISGWKNVDWPTRRKCGGKYTAGAARVFFVGLDLRREMRPSAPRVVEIAASKLDFEVQFATEFKMKRRARVCGWRFAFSRDDS